MILFGVRSPLIVDVEETLFRCHIAVTAAVSISGVPRLQDRSRLVDLAAFGAPAGSPFLATAFAPRRRRALAEQALALGLVPAPALIDPTAVLPRHLRVGAGSFINAGVVIGAAGLIGDHVLVNRAASLGHHVLIADFVSIGPGATLAGNIRVGEGAMIGAGATILPNVRIGENALVSAGAVVRKHVPAGALVAGHPATLVSAAPGRSSLDMDDGE
ncbi:MAG: acetyltransferase [Polymorphobacter sp.]|uniref:acetyltransferase n=1 Tax=Polymorphobacter sp. TaxID=1909290 RepID=UPI003A847AEC